MVHNSNRLRTAHILLAAAILNAAPALAQAEEQPPAPSVAEFPALPLPPLIEGLIGLPQTYTEARSTYLDLITREAKQKGVPPAPADAVVKVESGFKPYAVGAVGEVGLMQVRPETAAIWGIRAEPQVCSTLRRTSGSGSRSQPATSPSRPSAKTTSGSFAVGSGMVVRRSSCPEVS